jgi:hypothetical protein
MNTLLLIALLLASTTSFAGTEPGIDVTASVIRYSEFELTEKQSEIFDEATKLSAASRAFHSLYGRWPKDVEELVGRTSGVDLAVFEGKVMIETVAEGISVTFFDSLDIRRLLVTEGMDVAAEIRAVAHDPEFRIRVSVQASPPNEKR